MPDYGHELLFGSFLPPQAEQAERTLALAETTERLGLELVSVQDHPYQPRFLDSWTLLTAIATRTHAVRVFSNVANLPLRPPAVLARSAASLDILSSGRVELGLGTGAFTDAVVAMGGPRRRRGEAVDALAEAITVLRSLWTPGSGVRLDHQHYRLDGAKPGPVPVHPIGIWLGAYKKRMLELTGRTADGWIPSAPHAPPEQLAAMNRVIDGAAQAADREPAAIRRLYNVTGSFSGTGEEFLSGPPKIWIEQLAELALSEGISGFVLMVPPDSDADGETMLRRFAEEVVPGVRELVARERAGTGSSGTHLPDRPDRPNTSGREAADALGIVPTAEPAQRLSHQHVWEEAVRPTGPAPDPNTRYTEHGRRSGQHLVDIHDHLRQELGQLRDLVQQVTSGRLEVGTARSAINQMTLRQNAWTLGTYCESYCRAVATHHTVEDVGLFPRLRHEDDRLSAVLDRLVEEHGAIAEVLEQVDAALVAMVGDPDHDTTQVQRAVDLLSDILLSHLSYEEHELVEPIARLSISV